MREIAPRIYLMDKFNVDSGIIVDIFEDEPSTFLVYNLDTKQERYFSKNIFVPGKYETMEQAINLFRKKMSNSDKTPIYINNRALSLIDIRIGYFNPNWKIVKTFPNKPHQIQLYLKGNDTFVISNTDKNIFAIVSKDDFSSCRIIDGDLILENLLLKVNCAKQRCYMTFDAARLINKIIEDNLKLPFILS